MILLEWAVKEAILWVFLGLLVIFAAEREEKDMVSSPHRPMDRNGRRRDDLGF